MIGPPRARLPLDGRRILITRAPEGGERFAELLRRAGAEVVQIPLIRFAPPDSWEAFDRAVDRLDGYHLVLFTSATAVEWFFGRLRERDISSKPLLRIPMAAVGAKTAEALLSRGLRVEIVPESFRAEELLDALKTTDLAEKEVLFPRALEARELLVEELTRSGARVTLVPVYRTVRADENRNRLLSALSEGLDLVAFTATSTVNHFVEMIGADHLAEVRSRIGIACIGPVTAAAALGYGLGPAIVPTRSTLEDLVAAIAGSLGPRPGPTPGA